MSIIDILEIPLDFIKENLTGWVIVIFVIIIIYFVALRNYYIKKEQFYDQAVAIKNMEEIEDTENKQLLETSQQISSLKENRKFNTRDYKRQLSRESRVFKSSNSIDTDFNQNITKSKKTSTSRNTNTPIGKKVIEGFEDTTNNNLNVNENIAFDKQIISTTLFDNLNITEKQIQSCKSNYNNTIAQLLIDLGKLNDMYSKNRYLNIKKQFDSYLAYAIDNIINYLNNPIKSFNTLTRTSIRTDILITLNNVLEILINKTNNSISTEMNTLAMMNSTTINYNTQLKQITNLQTQLEKYIGIDKLISELGHNVSISNKEINNILDKSFILPIYEKN
jgi:hypothetical protein